MPKSSKKLYIVRKYVWAKSAPEAIKKSKDRLPDDVWVGDEFRKNEGRQLESAIGFEAHDEEYEE